MAKKATYENEVAVTFGSPGRNKTTRRIAIEVPAGNIKLDEVHRLFSNSQLSCKFVAEVNNEGDVNGQETLHGEPDTIEIEATADAKGYHTNHERIRVSLQMHLDAVHPDELDRFAFRDGTLLCTRTGDAVSEDGDGEE